MTAPAGEGSFEDRAPADRDSFVDAARPWLLGSLGAAAGLLIHPLLDGTGWDVPGRVAGASFTFFGAIALGLTLSPSRPVQSAIFSAILGLVMGGIAWHLASAGESLAGPGYAFAAGVFASLLAVPLFEAGFHRRFFATPYARAHGHAWTDAISGAGAAAFTGIAWLLLWLVDALLGLVGIELIGELIGEGWFAALYIGAAFGAALGVLRNNLGVIGALQSVVMLVLSLLALPFAAALAVFVAALIATGGEALWQATDSATPVLLACAAGAFLLANVVIRDEDAATSRNRVMQGAALALALAILPLSVFSAISMGMRVGQYGLAPERLWALVAIGVAVAFGLAYWVAAARGRLGGWREALRAANLRLAAGVCLLALILALPLFDFGAISAKNQLARLEAGEVSAEEFDYGALRWDFGAAGREALERLARGGGEVAREAARALRQEERWPLEANRREIGERLRVRPDDARLRALVTQFLESQPWRCNLHCVALELDGAPGDMRRIALVEGAGYEIIRLPLPEGDEIRQALSESGRPALDADSRVEIRELTRRYITVDGRPVGEPLD